MSRQLRVQFSGALYHVAARGNRKQAIYLDERDRLGWLDLLGEVSARFNFIVHGFCQMTNHYHLLLETVDGNLSHGIRQLDGEYARHFNHRHGQVGHLFQGRYYSEDLPHQAHMLAVARYVVLNPVRAGIVSAPADWRWSSYAILTGAAPAPPWFDAAMLLSQFGEDTGLAVQAYKDFVARGIDLAYPVAPEKTPDASRGEPSAQPSLMKAYPRSQRRASALTLAEYAARYSKRDEAMARAFLSTAYTMQDIAAYFGVSAKTVSRAVKQFEAEKG